MDGKRDYRCRIAADVLFAACYGLSSCAVIYAAALVWVADRRSVRCNYLYFYADYTIARCLGWIFSDYYAQQQCCSAHWDLSVTKRGTISRGACGLKKKNFIDKKDSHDSSKGS